LELLHILRGLIFSTYKMNEEELLNKALERAMPAIAIRIQNELILTCPVNQGRLRSSIKVMPTSEGIVIFMAEYGRYVIFGTNPHIIHPKSKKVLKFEKNRVERLSEKRPLKNSDIVFTKEVKHPGTRPNPFVQNAIQNKLKEIIIEEMNKVLK